MTKNNETQNTRNTQHNNMKQTNLKQLKNLIKQLKANTKLINKQNIKQQTNQTTTKCENTLTNLKH